jgi:hypothetical protein
MGDGGNESRLTICCNRRFWCVLRCLPRCISSRFGLFLGVGIGDENDR